MHAQTASSPPPSACPMSTAVQTRADREERGVSCVCSRQARPCSAAAAAAVVVVAEYPEPLSRGLARRCHPNKRQATSSYGRNDRGAPAAAAAAAAAAVADFPEPLNEEPLRRCRLGGFAGADVDAVERCPSPFCRPTSPRRLSLPPLLMV